MIVCVCANVSESEIVKLLPLEVCDVMLKTGCAMNCGACFETLIEIIEKQQIEEKAGSVEK